MAWQDPEVVYGRELIEDEFGNLYDPNAEVEASIPKTYELPVESFTEVANNPELLGERLVRVQTEYDRQYKFI